MRLSTIASCAVSVVLAGSGVAAGQTDVKGGKDHALFSRLPEFYIVNYKASDFDAHNFTDANGQKVPVEGKLTRIGYSALRDVKAAGKIPSALAISRNYTNAIKKAGGMVVHEKPWAVTMKQVNGDREVWAEIQFENLEEYNLTIVEKGEMKQEITAGNILAALDKDGHVALYINFDTGKADIKADGQAVIDEIATALRNTPALKVGIEGHTDNAGAAAANLKLSDARAQAVMAALVAKGIAAARLSAAGLGQTKPIADNATEDGRAKNRRVELVKK